MANKLPINTYPIAEIAALPRDNYRTEFDETDIAEFGERIKTQGQQTPVGVAVFPDGEQMFCFGERRLRAMLSTGISTIIVTKFQVKDMTEFKNRQMSENLDRSNTDAIDDGNAFSLIVANGMSKVEFMGQIQFPNGVNSKEQRIGFINDRIALAACHPSVHVAFRAGLIKEFKNGETQARVFTTFPHWIQEKVADQLLLNGKALTDSDLLKLFGQFAISFDDAIFPVDRFTDEVCAKLNGDRVCIDKAWFDEQTKTFLAEQVAIAKEMRAEIGQNPLYLLCSTDKKSSYGSEAEDVDPTHIYGYVLTEKGMSSHVKVGIVNYGNNRWNKPERVGQAVYFVDFASKCPILFPELAEMQKEKRTTRLESANVSEKKRVYAAACINAVRLHFGNKHVMKIEAAMEAEVTRAYVNSLPSLDLKKDLCKLLKCTVDELRFYKDKFFVAFTAFDKEGRAMETIISYCNAYTKAESAIHNEPYFAQAFNVVFDKLESEVENTIKERKAKVDDEAETIRLRNEETRKCLDKFRCENEVDFTNDKLLLTCLSVEKDMKLITRRMGINIKGISDPGERNIVVEKVKIRYAELVRLGIYDDKRIAQIANSNDSEDDDRNEENEWDGDDSDQD